MSLQSDAKSKDMVRNLHVTLNQIEPLFVHNDSCVFAIKLIVMTINIYLCLY